MNQADYESARLAILEGETARGHIEAVIESIIAQANRLTVARADEWARVVPKWSPIPQGIFNMAGSITSIEWVANGNLSVSVERVYSGCDPDYHHAYIPEVWLYDEEARALGLSTEFNRLLGEVDNKAVKTAADKLAADRAQFEKLKAQFGA